MNDDSLQNTSKALFLCGNVEENNIQVYASLKADIIDAYHWNVEKKTTSTKCLLTKNTRRASS